MKNQRLYRKTRGIKKARKELTEGKTTKPKIPSFKDNKQIHITKRLKIMDIGTNFYKYLCNGEDTNDVDMVNLEDKGEIVRNFHKSEV